MADGRRPEPGGWNRIIVRSRDLERDVRAPRSTPAKSAASRPYVSRCWQRPCITPYDNLMAKRTYVYAVASFLAIPFVVLAGFRLSLSIDPEWARGHADYVRNYQLLDAVRHVLFAGTIAFMVLLWTLELKREVAIRVESLMTATPVATIVAIQDASSGMWAFSEGLQMCYLVVLIYLIWPIVFNLGARATRRSSEVCQS
jgi:hypothetical protein